VFLQYSTSVFSDILSPIFALWCTGGASNGNKSGE